MKQKSSAAIKSSVPRAARKILGSRSGANEVQGNARQLFDIAAISFLLENRPKGLLFVMGIILNCLVGFVDYTMGTYVGAELLYFLPIFFVSWFCGRKAGVLMSVLSAGTLGTVDMLAFHEHYSILNTAAHLGMFVVFTYLLSGIRRALREISEGKNILSSILESAGEGIYVIDSNGNHTLVNRAAIQILGYAEQEILGKHSHPIWHHTRADGTPYREEECLIYATLRDGIAKHITDEVFWRKDGTSFPVEYAAAPIREKGEIAGTVIVFRDITERKQAEEALRFSEARYRALHRDNPTMIFTVDAGETILSVNPFGASQLGYTAEELEGQPVVNVMYGEDRPAFAEQLRTCLKNPGQTYRGKFRKVRKDGAILWVEETAQAVYDLNGALNILAVCQDITERKKAEDALRISEARFRNLFEQSPLSMQILSPDGKTLEVNRGWETLWGLKPEAIRDYNLLQDRQLEAKGIMPYIQKGFAGEATEIPVVFYDPAEIGIAGNVRWVKAFIYPVKDETGHIREIVLMHVDMTVLMKAEEELARSNEDLEQFAHVVSHDLQAPLRSIWSFAEILARYYRGRLDEEADKYFDFIIRGARRMQRMIDEILAYSRVGTRGGEFTTVDFEAVLLQTMENLYAEIEEKGAVITHDPLPSLRGDQSQIMLLLQNLLGNAIKFTVEAPRVHVSAVRKGSECVFSVRDNGIGIDPEQKDRIFTLFQRLHTAEEYPGTGLGLAVCKKIVERHGGEIWVESEPGKGSTFYFSLPAIQ